MVKEWEINGFIFAKGSIESHFDGNYGLIIALKRLGKIFMQAVHSISPSFRGNYKTINAVKMGFNTYNVSKTSSQGFRLPLPHNSKFNL